MSDSIDTTDCEGEELKDTPENVRMLNEKLGITSKENLFNSAGLQSINELFENSKKDFEILCRDIAEKKEIVENAEKAAKSEFDTFNDVKNGADESTKLSTLESSALALSNFSDTIMSMKELVDRGNSIISKLYDAIVMNGVLDPDLINSTASIIHGIRETNDNLIQFNIQKMQLEQQYRLAIDGEKLKQRNRLELEHFKYTLRIKEAEEKARIKREEAERAPVSVNVSDGNKRSWDQSVMAEIIRNSGNGK